MATLPDFESPEVYKIRPDYVINPRPRYCDNYHADRFYQPDVYLKARALMEQVGATVLVDIGCGQGDKLDWFSCEIVGVDFGPNLTKVREKYPLHTFIEFDLELGCPEIDQDILERSVVICSDVVEHLLNPLSLLNGLVRLRRSALGMVISTPDRDLFNGKVTKGPPWNPTHVREWTTEEFRALLSEYFVVDSLEITRSDDVRQHLEAITVVVSSKPIEPDDEIVPVPEIPDEVEPIEESPEEEEVPVPEPIKAPRKKAAPRRSRTGK